MNFNPNVPLRGLADVRIIEMPELVQLAHELTDTLPQLQRMPKAAGVMMPLGKGLVRLDPRIFADPVAAAKVLAHELGHVIDYLPQRTLARGNLWGRLHSLRKYMLEKFGGSGGVRQKELRAELIALTQYWHPYNPATASEHYRRYRESAIELYADFVSVLFNSPAIAKQMAPNTYREFMRGLDTKPEVKRAFVELQAWLSRPAMGRLRDRQEKVGEMFAKAEEIFERKMAEREVRFRGYRGWLSRLKQAAFDHFAPIRDRANASGDADAARSIRELFDGHPLASNTHWRWLERMHRQVLDPLEKAGFTMDDVGQQLFFQRVANERYDVGEKLAATLGIETGGRSTIANPLGHVPKTARDQLLAARLTHGLRRQTLLDAGVQRFHDEVFAVMQEAHTAGLLTDSQMAIIAQNRDNYAAFTPLEYIDTFVPAGFFHQAGTLKEIANPFVSTVLKVLQMQRAIQFQRVKTATVNFLSAHFPGEIARAEVRRGEGGRALPVPPREKGVQQIMVREAGRPAWFNVPAEIAAMFERPDVPLLESALIILDKPFREIFYPAFITFNPLFQLVRNPLRDARRSYVNSPVGVGLAGILRQLPLVKQIGPNPALDAVRAFIDQGKAEPLIAEMLANLAITPGEATFSATIGKPRDAFDRILQDHGLLPPDEQATAFRRVFGKLRVGRVLDAIERAGRMNELLPKASLYGKLRAQGWAPKDAAYYVRNFIGTPNFTRRGTHIGLANAFVPFINIWTKGWAADAQLATRGFERQGGPGKSPASYWMRWAMTSGVWSVLKAAAVTGLLGAGLKALFDGIGDFDKTNYDVIPLGYTGTSEFNPQGKVAYLKIPKDPTDRLMSGLAYNSLRALMVNAAQSGALGAELKQMNAGADGRLGVALSKNMSIAAGDVPGLNPALKIAQGWLDYSKGHNPIDDFRGHHILSDAEHLAGGWDAAKPMLAWTFNQTGMQGFVRYDPDANTTLEQTLNLTPLANGLVRISDYGFREQQALGEKLEDAAGAALRLSLPDNARRLNTEFHFLRSLGADDRTPTQEARYQQLRGWHASVWQIAEQQLRDAREMGYSEETRRAIRSAAEQGSKAYAP